MTPDLKKSFEEILEAYFLETEKATQDFQYIKAEEKAVSKLLAIVSPIQAQAESAQRGLLGAVRIWEDKISELQDELGKANKLVVFYGEKTKVYSEAFHKNKTELEKVRSEKDSLRNALRPFANMSECIENEKDFKTDGDYYINAKKVMEETK